MILVEYIRDFAGLLYPRTCCSCNNVLQKNEHLVCTFCHYDLPETNSHNQQENKLTEYFWGRVKIETATALYYYQKGCKVQKLIHEFKYRGKREAGVYAGKILGAKLKTSTLWDNLDSVIPVPLHPKRQRQRGFNQSEYFARGLSESLGIELSTNNLVRKYHSESQTRRSRFSRWKNIETAYQVKNPDLLKNKNLLLADDVITTGSTLEACAHKLLEAEGARVWIATLAMAS